MTDVLLAPTRRLRAIAALIAFPAATLLGPPTGPRAAEPGVDPSPRRELPSAAAAGDTAERRGPEADTISDSADVEAHLFGARPARSVAALARAALRRPERTRVWLVLPAALQRMAENGTSSAREARRVADDVAAQVLGLGTDGRTGRSGRPPHGESATGLLPRNWGTHGWPLEAIEILVVAGGLLTGIAGLAVLLGWPPEPPEDRPSQVAVARLLMRLGAARGEVAKRTGIPRDALALIRGGRTSRGADSDSGTNFRPALLRGAEDSADGDRQVSVYERIKSHLALLAYGEHPLRKQAHGTRVRTDDTQEESGGTAGDANSGEGSSLLAAAPERPVQQPRERRKHRVQG